MLSIKTLIRIIKYKSKIDPETGETPSSIENKVSPEDISLTRVEESKGNYHNKIELKYSK